MASLRRRLESDWRGLKYRVSSSTRFAAPILLIIMALAAGSVVAGWHRMAKDTFQLQSVKPVAMTAVAFGSLESVWPGQTLPQGEDQFRGNTDLTDGSLLVTTHVSMARPSETTTPEATSETDSSETASPEVTSPETTSSGTISSEITSSEKIESITIVQTTVITITSVVTDTELQTMTTTVILSTSIIGITAYDSSETAAPTTDEVMTGIMYCSYTGHVYTLCPLVHTSSPAMLTGVPVMVSQAAPGPPNPFVALRLAITKLWNSTSILGKLWPRDNSKCCSCDELETAMSLVRVQQDIMDAEGLFIQQQMELLSRLLEKIINDTAYSLSQLEVKALDAGV